jgi:hypothetical protein
MYPHSEKEILHEAGGYYPPREIEGSTVTVKITLENPTVTYQVVLRKDPPNTDIGWAKEGITIIG